MGHDIPFSALGGKINDGYNLSDAMGLHLTEQCIALLYHKKLDIRCQFTKSEILGIERTLSFFGNSYIFSDQSYKVKADKALSILHEKYNNLDIARSNPPLSNQEVVAEQVRNKPKQNMKEELPNLSPKRHSTTPFLSWNFESGPDKQESLPLTLHGNSVIRNGRLWLDGKSSYVTTEKINTDLGERTFEIWLSINNLSQFAAVPFYITDGKNREEDGLIYNYDPKRKWLNYSPQMKRTMDSGGFVENIHPGQLLQLVITYAENDDITIFRNGDIYGNTYRKGKLVKYPSSTSIFYIGGVANYNLPPRNFLNGSIEEINVYDRALNPNEVADVFNHGKRRLIIGNP